MKLKAIGVFSLFFLLSSHLYAESIDQYYQSVYGKHSSSLKQALHQIIDNHKTIKYTISGNDNWYDGVDVDVWEALTYTDSACADEVPKCGLVQLLYLDETRHISQANRGGSLHDSWDREHVWPKSRGFPKKKQDGYTDLHHLRPADRNLNGKHSNYGYDIGGVAVKDKRENGDVILTTAKFDKVGQSFEPTDRSKGQVARMLFYMAVRYETGDDGINEAMPDLEIKDKNARVKEPWIGDLCTLLEWHNLYGPSHFERRRNNRVMEIQGNRNPFIDQPGWANLIWGDQCLN